MNDKKHEKLLEVTAQFLGMTLRHISFKESPSMPKSHKLVLELSFEKDGVVKEMVLSLDESITFSDSERLYDLLVK